VPEPLVIEIPGFKVLRLKHLVMDVNGTLALDGQLVPGVFDLIKRLEGLLEVQLLTADTNNRQPEIDALLGLRKPGKIKRDHAKPEEAEHEWKEREIRELGADSVVALGNGRNDVRMLQVAALGIAVLNREGLALDSLKVAHVVAPDPVSALELLLHRNRLVASLRQ
jgi:soluble P-type ATPase